MKKKATQIETRKLAADALTLVKGGRGLTSPILSVTSDGVEWTRTGYGEDVLKGPRDCD